MNYKYYTYANVDTSLASMKILEKNVREFLSCDENNLMYQ